MDKHTITPGDTFGKWTVIRPAGKDPHGNPWFECRCECGRLSKQRSFALRGEGCNSCGSCANRLTSDAPPKHDRVGERHGKRVVIAFAGRHGKRREPRWLVRCDCGRRDELSEGALKQGSACRDCRSRNYSRGGHGESVSFGGAPTPEYHSWMSMRKRCHYPGDKRWEQYGGRGIIVCDRWESFECFLSDMGRRPTSDHSLDRIDVDGNYEPGNCRWATRRQQMRNRTNNVWIEAFGERLILAEWSRRSGLYRKTIKKRIDAGWHPEDAVSVQPGGKRRK